MMPDNRPEGIYQHPSDSRRKRDCRQSHFFNQQPGENYPQSNMTRSADKWDGNMADSVEITGKGVAGKAKCIEERNELHVMAGIFVRRAVMSAQHKADGAGGRTQLAASHAG